MKMFFPARYGDSIDRFVSEFMTADDGDEITMQTTVLGVDYELHAEVHAPHSGKKSLSSRLRRLLGSEHARVTVTHERTGRNRTSRHHKTQNKSDWVHDAVSIRENVFGLHEKYGGDN